MEYFRKHIFRKTYFRRVRVTTPPIFFRTVPSYNCCVCLIKMSTPFLMPSDSRIQVWWLSYSLTILLSGIHPEHNSWLVKRKRVEEYHSNIIGRRGKEEHWYQMNSSSEVFSVEYDRKLCNREKEWSSTPWVNVAELKENNVVRREKEIHWRINQDDFMYIMPLEDTHK